MRRPELSFAGHLGCVELGLRAFGAGGAMDPPSRWSVRRNAQRNAARALRDRIACLEAQLASVHDDARPYSEIQVKSLAESDITSRVVMTETTTRRCDASVQTSCSFGGQDIALAGARGKVRLYGSIEEKLEEKSQRKMAHDKSVAKKKEAWRTALPRARGGRFIAKPRSDEFRTLAEVANSTPTRESGASESGGGPVIARAWCPPPLAERPCQDDPERPLGRSAGKSSSSTTTSTGGAGNRQLRPEEAARQERFERNSVRFLGRSARVDAGEVLSVNPENPVAKHLHGKVVVIERIERNGDSATVRLLDEPSFRAEWRINRLLLLDG
mmetsp:Transcript_134254/g.287126  ORF Transcript_134254/g.287126 Transcript_134254/m.287126 type:complete len:328 (+) Transcript_134254:423-1406(+)